MSTEHVTGASVLASARAERDARGGRVLPVAVLEGLLRGAQVQVVSLRSPVDCPQVGGREAGVNPARSRHCDRERPSHPSLQGPARKPLGSIASSGRRGGRTREPGYLPPATPDSPSRKGRLRCSRGCGRGGAPRAARLRNRAGCARDSESQGRGIDLDDIRRPRDDGREGDRQGRRPASRATGRTSARTRRRCRP